MTIEQKLRNELAINYEIKKNLIENKRVFCKIPLNDLNLPLLRVELERLITQWNSFLESRNRIAVYKRSLGINDDGRESNSRESIK